jgi:hypothetical protein
MNRVAKWLVAAAMMGIGSAALAQDIQFNVAGQFEFVGTLSGELMINTTTGSFDSGSVTVAGVGGGGIPLDGTFNVAPLAFLSQSGGPLGLEIQNSVGSHLYLFVPVTTLVGFQGDPLIVGVPPFSNTDSGVFSSTFGDVNELSSGSVSPAATPEIDPASVASGLTLLLGSLMVLRGRGSGVVAA